MQRLAELSDAELGELGQAVQVELRHRALLRFEPAVLADRAFDERFDSKGWPCDPVLIGGYAVCCGALKAKASGNHRCSFVVADEQWVWDAPNEHDEIRNDDDGRSMSCVTLVIAVPGLTLTQVESRFDGSHKRLHAWSWQVRGDTLEPVPTPFVPKEHRRS